MGALTVEELLDEGGLLAADDTQQERALIWFNNWLTKTYRGWKWPFNKVRSGALTLSQGATSLVAGAGSGGVTDVIQEIFNPIYVYTSDYTRDGTAPITERLQTPAWLDDAGNNAANRLGMPFAFKCRAVPTMYGRWTLLPYPIPDVEHLLQFDYLKVPARLALSETPVYPEDRTLVQAAKCAVLEYSDGPGSDVFMGELQVLASMISDDRINFGTAPGDGQYIQFDTSVFR